MNFTSFRIENEDEVVGYALIVQIIISNLLETKIKKCW